MKIPMSALAGLLLAWTPAAHATPPAREPLVIQEPAWKGAAPSRVTPAYQEALAKLQSLASAYPEGAPLRVTSPAPCVLRLARGHDPASFPDAGSWFLLQITWVDLSKADDVGAQSFGTKPISGQAMAATCAWLSGDPGLALSTEVVALAGKPTANRRSELAAEEQPRLCVGGEVEPGQLETPLRALVAACGGSPASGATSR